MNKLVAVCLMALVSVGVGVGIGVGAVVAQNAVGLPQLLGHPLWRPPLDAAAAAGPGRGILERVPPEGGASQTPELPSVCNNEATVLNDVRIAGDGIAFCNQDRKAACLAFPDGAKFTYGGAVEGEGGEWDHGAIFANTQTIPGDPNAANYITWLMSSGFVFATADTAQLSLGDYENTETLRTGAILSVSDTAGGNVRGVFELTGKGGALGDDSAHAELALAGPSGGDPATSIKMDASDTQGEIVIQNKAGASITLGRNGDIIFRPGPKQQ